MPEAKRISINDAPRWFKLVLVLLPLAGIALINKYIHNDLYFLYPTGEYIVNNGFPHTDILSMHSSMTVVIQQWLSSVIFYYAYSAFGNAGAIAVVYLCYVLLVALIYKLCYTISENFFVSCVFSFIISILMAAMYEVSRPQVFTFLIITAELLCLEKFVKTKKVLPLFFIPVLSVLLVNLHAAMWGMMFVFAAPYVAASLPVKFKKIRQEPCCSFVKLLICGIVTFAVGFINPYGFGAMFYVLTSFGLSDINKMVYEMRPVSFSEGAGKLFFFVFGVLVLIAVTKKKKEFSTRFVLMFAGTALLAMLNIKSISYFLIAGVPAFTYLIKDADCSLPLPQKTQSKPSNKKRIVLLAALFVALAVLAVALSVNTDKSEPQAVEEKSTCDYIDEMADIIDASGEEITLFAGFDWGQYLEYKGYHPYIDGRAELFFKKNNGEFDYLNEYNRLMNGSIYYKDFVEKYKFNYLIVSNREQYLRMSLKNDSDFTVLLDSDDITLFKANY